MAQTDMSAVFSRMLENARNATHPATGAKMHTEDDVREKMQEAHDALEAHAKESTRQHQEWVALMSKTFPK